MEIEDGLPRAAHQAACLAMRDRRIRSDQIERELDDHADPAELAALKKTRPHFHGRIDLE